VAFAHNEFCPSGALDAGCRDLRAASRTPIARADEVIELENLLQGECRLLADSVAEVG
jgi:hypothetical protein